MSDKYHHIRIHYCTQCKWLLRAAWMAQELLSTFEQELSELSLIPSGPGVFTIHVGDQLLWDRKQDGGFPSIKQLKQLVRDHIFPEKSLGHYDREKSSGS